MNNGYRDFVTQITYRIDNQVHILGVVEGRENTEIVAFYVNNTIQTACCDLYDGYINAYKEMFKKKVPVVANRFHVRN
jgi:transposase